MADNTDIIREWLIGLGFSIDAASERRFKDFIGGATKNVEGLGKTLEIMGGVVAAAVGVTVAGVEEIADSFEKLYYSSQRTGDSVENLNALRFAAGQIGLTADQASAAIERFSTTLQTQPGLKAFLAGMGVGGKNATEIFNSFIAKMREIYVSSPFGPGIVESIGQKFGLDYQSLLMYMKGLDKLKAAEDRQRDALRDLGVDADQVARQSVDLNNAWRDLWQTSKNLTTAALAPLIPMLTDAVEWMERAEKASADWARSNLTLSAAGNVLEKIFGPRDSWDTEFKALITNLEKIGDWYGKWMSLGKDNEPKDFGQRALLVMRDRLHEILDTLVVITDLLTGQFRKAWDDIGKIGQDVNNMGADVLGKPHDGAPAAPGAPAPPAAAGGAPAARAAGPGVNSRAAQVLRYFVGQGYSRNAALGIIGNLFKESSLRENVWDPTHTWYGIAQWDKNRRADFAKQFGHGIEGSSFEEQLAFIQWEMTHGSRSRFGWLYKQFGGLGGAAGAGGIFSRGFEAPANGDFEARLRGKYAEQFGATLGADAGKGGNTVTQHNEVNIHGVPKPEDVAYHVKGALNRANGDLQRNFAGVMI